jgi:ABC-type branched-subunit amino acid transport system substrate-binding protein
MIRTITATVILLLFYWLVAGTQTAAQQALPDEFPRAQSLFAKAQRLMREKDYPAAIDAYDELVKGFKYSQYRDIYNYALARAYYLSGDYGHAATALSNYHSLFPNSSLTPYAYHLMANCAYRGGQLESAFRLYARAYRSAHDNHLRDLSRRSLLAAVEAGYFPPDSVLSEAPRDLECPIRARMAFLITGYWSREQIDSFMIDCPEESPAEEKPPLPESGSAVVGLMLPLSGAFAKYGEAILDGAMLAAEMLKREGFRLELLVYDTKSDHITAAREAQALAKAQVDLVIGPLLSNIAATAAAVLSAHHIPLLVPAASQAGFTDLSPLCFQMSPNMVAIGRGMAQYAARHRGMTTMAVITPTTIDETTIAESFVTEAKRLGVDIIAVEKFRPGETDFGPYIRDIKEAILGPIEDSTFYVTLEGDTLKPGEMPVTFDGIFIPATEKQLFLMLPQLNFYRVDASYLGTDEWNTEKVLKLGEKVLRDAVFYSSRAAMHHSAKYEKFATAYDAKYGSEPDRLAAIGYDAVSMLADAMREGRQGPGDIAGYLRLLDGYEGASGRITFGTGRSNLELPLFTLKEGLVRPLVERPPVEEPPTPPSRSVGVEVIKYDW